MNKIKTVTMAAIVFIVSNLYADKRQPVVNKLWETEPIFKVPESILYDPADDFVYVSNIDGKSDELDGKGFISRMDLEGRIIDLKWVSGLNAPKGMAIFERTLYVTDILDLVVIDIAAQEIRSRIPAPDAQFLNDIAVDKEGNVYISDMRNNTLYRYARGQIEKWYDQVEQPNGLYYEEGILYVGNSGTGDILTMDVMTRSVKVLAGVGHGIDGLKRFSENQFITSDWMGRTTVVHIDEGINTIIDTREDNINSADLEYIMDKRILLIPTFYHDRVIAYTIEY